MSSADSRLLLNAALQKAQSINGGLLPVVPGALDPATKHARKIYVGNLPVVSTEAGLKQFFNEALASLFPAGTIGQPIVSCYLNLQRRFAFLEHRTIEEANFTLSLDGIQYAGHALKLRRPQDYNPSLAEMQIKMAAGLTTAGGSDLPTIAVHIPPVPDMAVTALQPSMVQPADGIHRVHIGGLPQHLSEDEIKDTLTTFGSLKSFRLVKDTSTATTDSEKCCNFAYVEWTDPNVTDTAIQALSNMKFGDAKVSVRLVVGSWDSSGTSGGKSAPKIERPLGRLSRILRITSSNRDTENLEAELEQLMDEVERECAACVAEGVRTINLQENSLVVECARTADAIRVLRQLDGRVLCNHILTISFCELPPEMREASVERILSEAEKEFEYLKQQSQALAH